jgi:dihydroorotate dehydrogenase electron transfer subunit
MNSCVILSNSIIAKDTYKMTLHCDFASKCTPGQFIHVMIPDLAANLLRRPFSLNSVDIANETIDIVYKPVGTGTKVLSELQPGTGMDVLGPLGNGFSIPENTKKIWLVGGGLGIAPLLYVPQYFNQPEYEAFLGFCDEESAYQVDAFEKVCSKVHVSSDDGSLCRLGFVTDAVTDALKDREPDIILSCGPVPMLHSLKRILVNTRIPCQASLEERMGCGVGACLTCNCKVNHPEGWHYARVCKEGPVFTLSEVEL